MGCTTSHEQIILIGPVIGLVTHNSARVIVEFSEDDKVTAILKSDSKSYSTTIQVEKEKVAVFKFEGLSPETKYTFSVERVEKQIPSGFKTLPEKLSERPFKIAIGGCDDLIFNNKLGENSLYYEIADRAKSGDLDLIIHNGDQVYIDHKEHHWNPLHTNVYDNCYKLIHEKEKNKWVLYEEEIVHKMKDLYRKTWSGKVAEAMANCPNLMQYDDHEIHNNFGYEDKFTDQNDAHSFVVKCARRVYYEYQRQLREDIDYISFSDVTCDYFSYVLNNVGFFFLDHRGARSTWYNAKFYLGKKQIDSLKSCLTDKFKDCPIVIILSQNPLVIHNYEESRKDEEFEEFIYNDKEKYGEFLTMLDDHKKNTKQEIFLVGGDVHVGGHTEIYKNGVPCFKQIVSSGIGQRTKESIIKYCKKVLAQTDTNLPGGFSFKHHDWSHNRNYATVELKLVNNSPVIESYLTISDIDIKPSKQPTIISTTFSISSSTTPNNQGNNLGDNQGNTEGNNEDEEDFEDVGVEQDDNVQHGHMFSNKGIPVVEVKPDKTKKR